MCPFKLQFTLITHKVSQGMRIPMTKKLYLLEIYLDKIEIKRVAHHGYK